MCVRVSCEVSLRCEVSVSYEMWAWSASCEMYAVRCVSVCWECLSHARYDL